MRSWRQRLAGVALAAAVVGGGGGLAGAAPASAGPAAGTDAVSATAPTAPQNVTAVAGDRAATLSWTAPTSDGGSPITHYVVKVYVNSSAEGTYWVRPGATSKVFPSLGAGKSTAFLIWAVNAIGPGRDAVSNAVVPTGTKPYSAPFPTWSAYATQAYTDLLGRPPTSAELASAVSSLGLYGPKAKLAASIRTGAEHTANVDPTARLYRAFLGRTPDANGLMFWIGRRRAGTWTLSRMADSFASSNEFKTKYGSLTNRQFVTRIYTDVLGRAADASGVTYWTGKLDRKEKTRGQVMVGFSESSEYQRKQVDNTNVAVAYILLLRRAPTATEIEDWRGQSAFGTSPANLLHELLNGPAYQARFA